jgi:hypothetical protein
MTAQKLYETLAFMVQLDSQLRLQATLDSVKDMLNNLVSSPAHPQYQSSLGGSLEEFKTAAGKLASAISPSQATTIKEMSGEEFFDPAIADKVQAKISANAMTPQVARDFVTDLATRRAAYLTNLNNTISGLKLLNVQQSHNPPGSADVAFLIPRELFENHLGEFTKELGFINRLIQHVAEGVTGESVPVPLESLSSSIPTITLQATAQVVVTLATIVTTFLATWERVLKFRKVGEELLEIGMKGKAVDELTEQVHTVIEETVEESTKIVFKNYNGRDERRKNELQNAVRTDVWRLYGQIERGLSVEFRANPKNAEDESKEALQSIVDLNNQMKFPGAAPEPLLLQCGEVLEGEIYHSITKKTTTQKSPKRTS